MTDRACDPEAIGRELARRLREAGAGDILQDIRPSADPVEPQALT